jgi:hypothetical protein
MVNRHRRSIVPTDIEQAEENSLDERQSLDMAEASSAQEEDDSPKPDHPVELIGVGSRWPRPQPHHEGTDSSFGATGNGSDKEQRGKDLISIIPQYTHEV